MGKALSLFRDVWENRTLLFRLAKNDFKTRYAGNYLGIVWAFIQPIVTVLVYWFVFEVAFTQKAELATGGVKMQIPFVLFLVSGIVPWFYFQDALMSGTNCFMEYSYLVKKVVFKISILPVVKLVSALFVHVFFVAFIIVLFAACGFYPDLYLLQVIYYSFAMFVLVLGLVYLTSAVMIFFRDLGQIISIVLQVGIWLTPIMWNIDMVKGTIVETILKFNPMYYIVQGYRDAFIYKVWFFEHWKYTIYFWVVTAIVFLIGTTVYKRLRIHFADVL